MDYSSRYRRDDKPKKSDNGTVEIRRTQREIKRMEDARMIRENEEKKTSLSVRLFWLLFQAVLVVMLAYVSVFFFGQIRTNVGQSMDTTLSGGDEVLINTLAYQVSGPSRGDIISFRANGNNSSRSTIRRVVGLPGETLQIKDGMIYINGEVYIEQKNYPAITNPGMASEPIKLDEDEYFVLGDNRNNSEDSRFADIGIVTDSMIEGRAWFILKPSSRRGFIRR